MMTSVAPSAAASPSIHEAWLCSGPSGAVEYGVLISEQDAVRRRQSGLDIVVRSPNGRSNRQLAGKIESAVGPAVLDPFLTPERVILPYLIGIRNQGIARDIPFTRPKTGRRKGNETLHTNIA